MPKYNVSLSIGCNLDLEGFEAEDEEDIEKKVGEADWQTYLEDFNLVIDFVDVSSVETIEEIEDD